jgi:hypothetical protein
MAGRPDEEPSVLDRITAVLPWIGGAAILLVVAGIVRSSLKADDPAPVSPPPTVVNKPVIPPEPLATAQEPAPTSQPVTAQQQLVAEQTTSNPSVDSPASAPPSQVAPSTSTRTYSRRPDDSAPRDVHVRGYTRKDGTYVAPYTRRSPRR